MLSKFIRTKMVKKKRSTVSLKKTNSKNKEPFPLRERTDIALKNFFLFLVIFIFSFVLYNFSSGDLFKNFFGILSLIFGFLSLAFLIAFIVLAILKSGSRKK